MKLVTENAQEIVNIVWEHFVINNNPRSVLPRVPAYLPGKIPAYRGENGAKCAAGLLIPDEEYRPSMERHAISHYIKDKPLEVYDTLCELQLWHDAHWGLTPRDEAIALLERTITDLCLSVPST